MTATLVQKSEVEAAFKQGGYTVNERFPECGFLYFPASAPWTRGNPDQGRVFWEVDAFKYPEGSEGEFQRMLDDVSGLLRDAISISASWGFPTDKQQGQILELLRLYVLYQRENRGQIPQRLLNFRKARREQREEEETDGNA